MARRPGTMAAWVAQVPRGGVRANSAMAAGGSEAHPASRRTWKVKDVAEFLQASESWVRHAAAAGRLPCTKIGGLLRFDPDEIRSLARASCRRLHGHFPGGELGEIGLHPWQARTGGRSSSTSLGMQRARGQPVRLEARVATAEGLGRADRGAPREALVRPLPRRRRRVARRAYHRAHEGGGAAARARPRAESRTAAPRARAATG